MDEAVEFIRAFIKKEHEATLALYGERDEAVFRQKVVEVLRCLDASERIQVGLTRPEPADKRWFRDGRDALAITVPRALFMVARYQHTIHGEIFRAYLGDRLGFPRVSYSESLFYAHTPDGLRIVAQYPRCSECRGAAVIGDEKCPECDSSGFSYLSGVRFAALGAPVELRKFQAPTEPVSLAFHEKA
jgi:hypothetical protein